MKKSLFYFLLCASSMYFSYAQNLKNLQRIPLEAYFTNPVVSPDGQFTLLTNQHFKGVYLLNLSNNQIQRITDKEGSGYGYSWNEKSDTFYFKQKNENEFFYNSKTYSYSILDQKIEELPEINANYLPSFKGFKKGGDRAIVVYTNLNTLQIFAKNLHTQEKWLITQNDGQYYNAIRSNDGKKVAVHNGADIYIYDIDGQKEGVKIGSGIATSWSPNDDYLIGFLDQSSDGHTIDNSEIYLFNPKEYSPKKITNTEVISEMFPSFIDENTIIFSDDKTGRIFTFNIK
ncbi:hypothetical protein GOQ30_17340 [Flavobacterium sp. TP390]|uniref:WD40-like Beta Propeller Repeat n=1 Tax=Flavobacterium profundi TaxID=1774945 RepID=A0A6I4IVG2_9FLAO|nr:hypothetical protein [Flavobacterium profundi]MVO10939.1 hypothetical protein [Flavobacterium profundi]